MNVLVLNPPRVDGNPVVREEKFEHRDVGSVYAPMSLLSTAGLLRKAGHAVRLFDANGFDRSVADVAQVLRETKPEVVISRLGFDTQEADLAVLRLAKDSGATVIVRNSIIADVPGIKKTVLQSGAVDLFADCEYESLPPAVVESCRDRQAWRSLQGVSFLDGEEMVTTPAAPLLADLDSLPFPAYDLLGTIRPYYSGIYTNHFTSILSSYGCPFRCAFCAYARHKSRFHSAEYVVNLLSWLKKEYGLKNFLFFDDTFTLNRQRVFDICTRMEQANLGLTWSTCTRANLVTREMLQAMKRAGCRQIAFGIESGVPSILKTIQKDVTTDEMREAAALCKEVGILFSALVILGLPGETRETVQETVRFIKEIDPFYTQFTIAIPYPNSAMYEYYRSNNLILSHDWKDYCTIGRAIIRTEALTTEELMELKRRAYLSILVRPSYLLGRVRWNDWRWNFYAFVNLSKRLVSLMAGKQMR
jgi:anaerobic magnesium-protoporphyrin IX monomethyl ester cyclase